MAQAEGEGRPLFEVEEQLTQTSHADVGGYLLSLWGLPDSVVAAAAHHHHPQRGPQDRLDSTAVVYVANLLAIERGAAEKGGASPAFDMECLSLCGAADHLEEWRRLADEVQPRGPLLVG